MNSGRVFTDNRGLSPLVHYENWTKLQHEEKKHWVAVEVEFITQATEVLIFIMML